MLGKHDSNEELGRHKGQSGKTVLHNSCVRAWFMHLSNAMFGECPAYKGSRDAFMVELEDLTCQESISEILNH